MAATATLIIAIVAASVLVVAGAAPATMKADAAHCAGTVTAGVVVYGATPAGIAAAIAAANTSVASPSVLLVAAGSHVGGMMASGLGWDDVDTTQVRQSGLTDPSPVPAAVYGSGVYAQFAQRVEAHYAAISSGAQQLSVGGTRHEPSVAEAILADMLRDANVSVCTGLSLASVTKATRHAPPQAAASAAANGDDRDGDASSLVSASFVASPGGLSAHPQAGLDVSARAWIDGTYTGDLAAAAGVPTRIGREGRSETGELAAGVVFMESSTHTVLRGSTGAPSPRVPAMTWRLCFSNVSSNIAPLTSPPLNYNRSTYLGYVDDLNAKRIGSVFNAWSGPRPLPPNGSKFDMNCNPRPLGFVWVGPQKEEYITANATRRVQLVEELRNLTLGLLWFQQNDVAVPPDQRAEARRYGLCVDEFKDNGNFPWQLYVREARRIVGFANLTEHDMIPANPDGRPPLHAASIAPGTYAIDSFPASPDRPAVSQQSSVTPLEGYVGMYQTMVAPTTLPAGMIVSPAVANLVVPTAASATHVAFSAVRLEPTWMSLGVAAGLLASLAIQTGDGGGAIRTSSAHPSVGSVDVAAVNLLSLQRSIVADGGLPPLFFNDLWQANVSPDVRAAMLTLGSHGIATDDSFAADADGSLRRGVAATWLFGALRARNSSVTVLAPGAAPPAPGVAWADFGPGDNGFNEAVDLAAHGIVTPPPDKATAFRPAATITGSEWSAWLGRATRVAWAKSAPMGDAGLSRGSGAVALLAAVSAHPQ